VVGRVEGVQGIVVDVEEGEVRRKSLVKQVVVGKLHLRVSGMQRHGRGEVGERGRL
jgi:hypothetical protein